MVEPIGPVYQISSHQHFDSIYATQIAFLEW